MELHNLPTDFNFGGPKRIRKRTTAALVANAGHVLNYGKFAEYCDLSSNAVSMNPQLKEAILMQDIERTRKILTTIEDYEIDILDENGIGAIHYAAKHGFLEGLCLLVANKATINLRTQYGSTALHLAIRLLSKFNTRNKKQHDMTID